MSAKTVVCVICGKEVSKRKSLDLSNLGMGVGRSCREHEEVLNGVEELARKVELEHEWQEIEDNLTIMSLTEFVRVASCTLKI